MVVLGFGGGGGGGDGGLGCGPERCGGNAKERVTVKKWKDVLVSIGRMI